MTFQHISRSGDRRRKRKESTSDFQYHAAVQPVSAEDMDATIAQALNGLHFQYNFAQVPVDGATRPALERGEGVLQLMKKDKRKRKEKNQEVKNLRKKRKQDKEEEIEEEDKEEEIDVEEIDVEEIDVEEKKKDKEEEEECTAEQVVNDIAAQVPFWNDSKRPKNILAKSKAKNSKKMVGGGGKVCAGYVEAALTVDEKVFGNCSVYQIGFGEDWHTAVLVIDADTKFEGTLDEGWVYDGWAQLVCKASNYMTAFKQRCKAWKQKGYKIQVVDDDPYNPVEWFETLESLKPKFI